MFAVDHDRHRAPGLFSNARPMPTGLPLTSGCLWELLWVCFYCSVTKSCLTLCFPVPHHLLEFAQVHVHWIGVAIQPSHPLLPSSPPALNLSQHQGLFQWVSCLHQVTKVLALQFQYLSFWYTLVFQGWFPLRLTGLISLLSKGPARVFSSTTVWIHQFFGVLLSLLSSSHIHTWFLERP